MHGDDAPSGLPPDQEPDRPLGVEEADPDGEGRPRPGDAALPGLPEKEPQTDG
jgi:hypothetical protein